VDDAPADFIESMQRGIVGIELLIDRFEATRKLSQNRSDADRAGVVAGLADSPRRGAADVRQAMTGR
jgi:transcriptional regulator